MSDKKLQDDELLEAGLDLLEIRKSKYRFTHCISCGDEMRIGNLLVCADCLDEECDDFYKHASDDELDEEIDD